MRLQLALTQSAFRKYTISLCACAEPKRRKKISALVEILRYARAQAAMPHQAVRAHALESIWQAQAKILKHGMIAPDARQRFKSNAAED
jgi:hypothetical protein